MSKLLERAIEEAPDADVDAWDRQIERDAAEGKLDKLFEKARADHRAGKSKAL
jgi:hypothetical protein